MYVCNDSAIKDHPHIRILDRNCELITFIVLFCLMKLKITAKTSRKRQNGATWERALFAKKRRQTRSMDECKWKDRKVKQSITGTNFDSPLTIWHPCRWWLWDRTWMEAASQRFWIVSCFLELGLFLDMFSNRRMLHVCRSWAPRQ